METLRINVQELSPSEVRELTEALRSVAGVQDVAIRVRTRDHAPHNRDGVLYLEYLQASAAHVVALVVAYAHQAAPHVKALAKDVAKDGLKDSAKGAVIYAIHKFIKQRNKAKKKEIDGGDDFPLLYDADGNVIKRQKPIS